MTDSVLIMISMTYDPHCEIFLSVSSVFGRFGVRNEMIEMNKVRGACASSPGEARESAASCAKEQLSD